MPLPLALLALLTLHTAAQPPLRSLPLTITPNQHVDTARFVARAGLGLHAVEAGQGLVELGPALRDGRPFASGSSHGSGIRGQWGALEGTTAVLPGRLQCGGGPGAVCSVVQHPLLSPVRAGQRWQCRVEAGASTNITVTVALFEDATFARVLATSAAVEVVDQQAVTVVDLAAADSTVAFAGGAAAVVSFQPVDSGQTLTEVSIAAVQMGPQATMTDNPSAVPVSAEAQAQLVAMGARSIRYPGGTLADEWDWRQTVGPVLERQQQFGLDSGSSATVAPQIVSFGLVEAVVLAEEHELKLVLQINVLESDAATRALLDFLFAPRDVLRGQLAPSRALRPTSRNTVLFELGNEPSFEMQSAAHYRAIALAKALVIEQHLAAIGEDAGTPAPTFGWVAETTFANADWMANSTTAASLQLLFDWNGIVFDVDAGVEGRRGDWIDAHAYPLFGVSTDRRLLFEELMAGSANFAAILDAMPQGGGGQAMDVRVTEFHNIVDEVGNSGVIDTDHLVDAQAALVVAEFSLECMSAASRVREFVPYQFAQAVGFGLAQRNESTGAWSARPTGHLWSMLVRHLTGDDDGVWVELDVAVPPVEASLDQFLTVGLGNIGSGVTVLRVSAAASMHLESGAVRLALVSRHWNETVVVQMPETAAAVDGGFVVGDVVDVTTVAVSDADLYSTCSGLDAFACVPSATVPGPGGGADGRAITVPPRSVVLVRCAAADAPSGAARQPRGCAVVSAAAFGVVLVLALVPA